MADKGVQMLDRPLEHTQAFLGQEVKPVAPGTCHDCGIPSAGVFYRLSRLGYNVCPRCFQSRVSRRLEPLPRT